MCTYRLYWFRTEQPISRIGELHGKAARYPIQAWAVIHKCAGEPVSGSAVDIRSSGMKVLLEQPIQFHPGEDVTVEVEPPPHSDQPFSRSGIGRCIHDALIPARAPVALIADSSQVTRALPAPEHARSGSADRC